MAGCAIAEGGGPGAGGLVAYLKPAEGKGEGRKGKIEADVLVFHRKGNAGAPLKPGSSNSGNKGTGTGGGNRGDSSTGCCGNGLIKLPVGAPDHLLRVEPGGDGHPVGQGEYRLEPEALGGEGHGFGVVFFQLLVIDVEAVGIVAAAQSERGLGQGGQGEDRYQRQGEKPDEKSLHVFLLKNFLV